MVVELDASGGIALPVERRQKEEEVRRLFENAPIGLTASLINASILAGILRDWIEPPTLILWWAGVAGLTALRFAYSEWFRRVASQGEFDTDRWGGAFTAGVFASGLVWGAAGIWLFPQSVAHQTFLALVLGGMVAGASATYSIRMDAFLAYTLPALAPLAVRFFSLGDELHVAMGGMVVLFGILLTATALQVHRLTSRTSDLSGELIGLQSTLKAARESAGSLEARLERAEEERAALAREMSRLSEKTDQRVRGHAFVHVPEPSERRMESVVDTASTDLGEFLRGFARRWEATRPANIDVWWTWSEEPLAVHVSPPVLEVLFGQLLANAREAIGEERGSIEVRARPTAMEEESDDRESYVTIEVIDDGPGMSRTKVEQPFESLVRRHRGRVQLESALLRGTVVRLLLPAPPVGDEEEEHR